MASWRLSGIKPEAADLAFGIARTMRDSGPFRAPSHVLYLSHGTTGWNLSKALERRGFSRIPQTRYRLGVLDISATAERRYMASTAIPTEEAVLELEAGKIKDVPTRKKEGGGYSAENITVLEGL